jgi:Ni/Fe-hydrogenase subunit HybB-like protein
MAVKKRWDQIPQINHDLLAPLQQTGRGYWLLVGLLVLGTLAGAGAWIYQVETGIGQTNLHKPIFWGIYIGSFLYWIGVSHSGTLISCLFRLSGVEWRRPLTRTAELMAVSAVLVSVLFIFVHLGRPWRFFYLIPYPNQRMLWPNFRSPLMWDAGALLVAAIVSLIYIYLPLIPDFGLMRDRIGGWRRHVYAALSLGWRGSQTQWQSLNRAMQIITPLLIMVMVFVHSIVGWDLSVALVPRWHSTIMGPYFVIGALHSGLGLLVIVLFLLRRIDHLDPYIETHHFDKLGKWLLATTLLWGYMHFAEALVAWYGGLPDVWRVFQLYLSGIYAIPYWLAIVLALGVPLCTLSFPSLRQRPWALALIGLSINLGIYIERLLILVPSLGHPRLPYMWSTYLPSWIEVTILGGALALFMLGFLLVIKFVPVIAVWEEKEDLIYGAPTQSRPETVDRTV